MKGFAWARRLEGGTGGDKTDNEDRAEVVDVWDALVLVVADGAGGQPNGGAAAQRVVEIVQKAVQGEKANDDVDVWGERMAGIDRLLLRDKRAGQTTGVIIALSGGRSGRPTRLVGVTAGDSHAWLFGSGGEQWLTQQSRKPYLGSGAALPARFDTLWTDGTLLLATDGLYKYADHAQIAHAAQLPDIEQAAQSLLNLARLPDGSLRDDIGLLLCRREGEGSGKTARGGLLQAVKRLLPGRERKEPTPAAPLPEHFQKIRRP